MRDIFHRKDKTMALTVNGTTGGDYFDFSGLREKLNVYADRGNDTIITGASDDIIIGGKGRDYIKPGKGVNVVIGDFADQKEAWHIDTFDFRLDSGTDENFIIGWQLRDEILVDFGDVAFYRSDADGDGRVDDVSFDHQDGSFHLVDVSWKWVFNNIEDVFNMGQSLTNIYEAGKELSLPSFV